MCRVIVSVLLAMLMECSSLSIPKAEGQATPSGGYATGFEAGAPGWELSGLWAVDATPGSMPGGAACGGAVSLNYNNGAGFNTGSANQGDAISPMVDVASISNPVLRFWCNYRTETPATSYDRRILRVIHWDGSVAASYTLATTNPSSPDVDTCAAMGTWHQHTLALDGTLESIRIAFRFDTVDAIANNFEGWFVDDVSVEGAGPAGATPWIDLYATDFESATGWYKTGLWAMDGTPSGMPGGAAHAGSSSLNYNNGSNYNTGSKNSGAAYSPPIALAGTQVELEFWCNYETETTGLSYDRRIVEIWPATQSSVARPPLASYALGTGGAAPCTGMGVWHKHVIPIDPSTGGITVAFRFDTVDGLYNNYRGWFVDDFVVRRDVPAYLADAPDDLSGLAASEGALIIGPSNDFVPLADGHVILGDRQANTITILHVPTFTIRASYAAPAAPGDLEYDARNHLLYATLPTSDLLRLDLVTGAQTLVPLAAPAMDLAIGNDGIVFATLNDQGSEVRGSLAVIDGLGGAVLTTHIGSFDALVACDRPGNQLITGGRGLSPSSLTRYSFDPASLAVMKVQERRDGGSNGVDLDVSPDGDHIAFACGNGNVWPDPTTIWDFSSNDLSVAFGSWGTGASPASSDFSIDGVYLVAANYGYVRVFRAADHELMAAPGAGLPSFDQIKSVGFSRGGRIVYAYSHLGTGETNGLLEWFVFDP
ncbi:MAG: hypothetical protein HYY16_14835 [Planctomycetes bacterium]|nr:hypothetical protein [Planctomycetota bacterium]